MTLAALALARRECPAETTVLRGTTQHPVGARIGEGDYRRHDRTGETNRHGRHMAYRLSIMITRQRSRKIQLLRLDFGPAKTCS